MRGGAYFVEVSDGVDEECGVEGEEGDERGNGVKWYPTSKSSVQRWKMKRIERT